MAPGPRISIGGFSRKSLYSPWVATGILTIILLVGSYAISIMQGQPIIIYAQYIFLTWVTVVGAIVAATIYSRR